MPMSHSFAKYLEYKEEVRNKTLKYLCLMLFESSRFVENVKTIVKKDLSIYNLIQYLSLENLINKIVFY